MPDPSNFISPAQYDQYSADWLALLDSGDDAALAQAFQLQPAARLNFLTFSIDQILSLVTAVGGQLIKSRFLLVPVAGGQAQVSVALFAVDASGQRLSEYYIPTQTAPTATQAVTASADLSTSIPPELATQWLSDWVTASSLATSLFTTPSGPLHGFNFEVSTFKDPLAGAQPYAGKCLFLNCGLNLDAEEAQPTQVVYVGRIGSRTQGNLEGLPTDDVFYDTGGQCPPAS